MWLRFCVIFLRFFWFLLLSLPSAGLLAFSRLWAKSNGSSPNEQLIAGACFVTACILLGISLLFAAIWTMRYALAPFVLLCEPSDCGVLQAISYSVRATRGRLTEIFLFELSFLGWHLLDILVLPMLYCVPYMSTARGLFARFLIQSYESNNIAPF